MDGNGAGSRLPIHVVYAQEAREYSCVASGYFAIKCVLLRAMRLNTKFSWGIYAVTVALGLYSHMLP